jgi:hypothetical protein
MSVCPSRTNLQPLKRLSWNLIYEFFLICWEISNFVKNLTRIMGTLHEDRYTFMIISHWILLIIRNVSDKYLEKNHTFYSIEQKKIVFPKIVPLRDNVKRSGTPGHATADNIIRRMHFSCLKTKAKDLSSEYVVRLAFAWQQWLHERTSILCYTYVDCLVKSSDSPNYIFLSVRCLKF